MNVRIIASELQVEFLKNYETPLIQSVSAVKHKEGTYDVDIRFSHVCDMDIIAQVIFGAGISYGLDLKYSSYDNEPSRVR